MHRDIDPDARFGYRDFERTVGALVLGSATSEWIRANQPGPWPYAVPTWVLTGRPGIVADGHPVRPFAGPVGELHPRLLAAAGQRNVWVMGGGDVAAQFVAAGLVDELIVGYAPCTLGAGRPLLPARSEWVLAESGVNGAFLCARYTRRR